MQSIEKGLSYVFHIWYSPTSEQETLTSEERALTSEYKALTSEYRTRVIISEHPNRRKDT